MFVRYVSVLHVGHLPVHVWVYVGNTGIRVQRETRADDEGWALARDRGALP